MKHFLKLLPSFIIGMLFASCQPQETIGVLYMLNTSNVDTISLVSLEDDTLVVPKGCYSQGRVYFANIYGTWSESHYSYSMLNSAISSMNIKSILWDDQEYVLTDSLSKSFIKISSYTKYIEEREEFFYEMDNDFIEQVKLTCK